MNDKAGKAGTLYVVATPIGNLEDLSERAIRVLREADEILAEDTRHTGRLLKHLGIETPMRACHEHNEARRIPSLLDALSSGRNLALVSDAGTPLISDPGYLLVRAAHGAGFPVVPIPGPSSVTAALSVSGLPTDRFCFEGFLPARQSARRKRLAALVAEPRTLVFLEAPHRIAATVADMQQILGGGREVTIARELTKRYETVSHATLDVLDQEFARNDGPVRGEFVVVVAGAPEAAVGSDEADRVLAILLEEMSVSSAADVAARILGERRNRLYDRALELKPD